MGEISRHGSRRTATLAACRDGEGGAEGHRGAGRRARARTRRAPMRLGTSLRFLFPTSPATHDRFRSLLASMPKGTFIERPMGAYSPDEQARNLMEVAAAARAAGL